MTRQASSRSHRNHRKHKSLGSRLPTTAAVLKSELERCWFSRLHLCGWLGQARQSEAGHYWPAARHSWRYLQIRDRLRIGRPGYPLKLGIVLTIGGLAMSVDLSYREAVGGALRLQEVGPLLLAAGAAMVLAGLLIACCSASTTEAVMDLKRLKAIA